MFSHRKKIMISGCAYIKYGSVWEPHQFFYFYSVKLNMTWNIYYVINVVNALVWLFITLKNIKLKIYNVEIVPTVPVWLSITS